VLDALVAGMAPEEIVRHDPTLTDGAFGLRSLTPRGWRSAHVRARSEKELDVGMPSAPILDGALVQA
jgi:hypothetical protein